MSADRLERGDVVQIDPAHDPRFGGCFMVIDENKDWGALGYVQVPGAPGIAYYRCPNDAMVYVGPAAWTRELVEPDDDAPEMDI